MPSYRIKKHRGDYLRREFTWYGRCKPYTWVSAKHRQRADLLNIAEATRIAGEVEGQGFLRGRLFLSRHQLPMSPGVSIRWHRDDLLYSSRRALRFVSGQSSDTVCKLIVKMSRGKFDTRRGWVPIRRKNEAMPTGGSAHTAEQLPQFGTF